MACLASESPGPESPIRGCARPGIGGEECPGFGTGSAPTTALGNAGPVDARFVREATGGTMPIPEELNALGVGSGGLAAGVPETATVGATGAGAGSPGTEMAGAATAGCDATATGETSGAAAGAFAGFVCETPACNARIEGATRSIPAPLSQEMPRLWQVSHGEVVCGCSFGLVFTPGYVPPWQFAQPVVMPV